MTDPTFDLVSSLSYTKNLFKQVDSEPKDKDLDVGFRFHPTDVELITFYLKRKITGEQLSDVISEIDAYMFEPWDLPKMVSSTFTTTKEWYFFCQYPKKYAVGARSNSGTTSGYWRATGIDRTVRSQNRIVGMIKTLVYYQGRAPKGRKTDWVMHEYRSADKWLADQGVLQRSYVLCRLFLKATRAAGDSAAHTSEVVELSNPDNDSCEPPQKQDVEIPSWSLSDATWPTFPGIVQNIEQASIDNLVDKSIASVSGPSSYISELEHTPADESDPFDKFLDLDDLMGSSPKDSDIFKTVENEKHVSDKNLEAIDTADWENKISTSVAGLSTDLSFVSEITEGISYQPESSKRAKNDSFEVMSHLAESTERERTKGAIERTREDLLEALKDVEHRRICLLGKGGSGKTTVLKSLLDDPVVKEMFDQVIWLRNDIVRQLSSNSQKCSDVEFRDVIRQAFMDMKLLVILDDVQETINLSEIGIPDPDPDNDYWLVLGTRSVHSCDHVMVDKIIYVQRVPTPEAWELFLRQAGHWIDTPEIHPYAKIVIEKCCYSPLIISAVGSALRAEKSIEEWRLAVEIFGGFSDTTNTDDWDSLNSHIKYCYDRLKGYDVKTCFLFCALFITHEEFVPTSKLAQCFVNEGLLYGRTMAALRRAHDIIELLIKAGLIEATESGMMVKMHNVFRDFALAILSSTEEGYQMLVRPGYRRKVVRVSQQDDMKVYDKSYTAPKLLDKPDSRSDNQFPDTGRFLIRPGSKLKELPSTEELENASMIFLMDNELSSLPRNPGNFSNLVSLFLQRNRNLRVIPASFFDSMCTLKIVNLSETRIRSLPNSLFNVKTLQVLLLRDCKHLIALPSTIGQLLALQVLDLQGTELIDLPVTIGELANLTELRVSFYGSTNQSECRKLPAKLVTDGILSSLGLRELGMFVYPGDRRWELNAAELTKEVTDMMLYAIHFHFPELENLVHFLHSSQSWRNRDVVEFNFIVGHDFKHGTSQVSHDAESSHNGSERCLRFVNGESVPNAVVEVIARATSLYLDHHLSICHLTEFGINNMNTLKTCILRDCPEVMAIIDRQDEHRDNVVLPVLEYLSLNYLWNLKWIFVGQLPTGSLAMLKSLWIRGCPKLRFIFTSSMLKLLPHLEALVIEDCISLQHIVVQDDNVYYDTIMEFCNVETSGKEVEQTVSDGDQVLCNLTVLKLHFLPNLLEIWRLSWWPLVESMSFYNCPKLKNLHMTAKDAVCVKDIEAERAWWDSLKWDDPVLSSKLGELVSQIHLDDLR